MTYDILATGSSGNAVVINGEILIDCGVPYKTLEQSGYIPKLKLVLLTHSHQDHFNTATVGRLHTECPALRWGCCKWMIPLLAKAGIKNRIDLFVPGETGIQYKDGPGLEADIIPHDVPNCCWRISYGYDRLFYATDTGSLDGIKAEGYDLYLIEANHNQAEISARIEDKLSRGEFAYEYRAAQNHLSYEQATEWLAQNAGPNSRCKFLHQHMEKEP